MLSIEIDWSIGVVDKVTIRRAILNHRGMARARVSTPTLPVEVTIHLATRITALNRYFDATQCRDQVAQYGVVHMHTVLQIQPHDITKELARSSLTLILCLGARPIAIDAVEVLINLTCIA